MTHIYTYVHVCDLVYDYVDASVQVHACAYVCVYEYVYVSVYTYIYIRCHFLKLV